MIDIIEQIGLIIYFVIFDPVITRHEAYDITKWPIFDNLLLANLMRTPLFDIQ